MLNDFYCLDCEKYFTQKIKKGEDMECVFCGSKSVDKLKEESSVGIFELMEDLRMIVEEFYAKNKRWQKAVEDEKRRDMERRPN